ncbi:DEAD/DEAH box helicase [Paracoccaceae bacterium]
MNDMGIAAPLAAAIRAKGYDSLTPVQEAVLAEGVAGRDALVSAQTGSGKTVAFGLAIAPEVLAGQDKLLYADQPLALIVAPTRELALQVKRELDWLYGPAGAQIASCVGGMDYRTEKRSLERGAHIVVGTPGRLRDHIERGSLDLSGLRAAVLDEADEMLDLGFAEDLEFILAAAPEERRTLMFSATVPKEIEKLAATFQRDALRIVAQGESKQHGDIGYRAMSVAVRDREHAIFNTLRYYEAQTAIVFCKTRVNVNHLFARMGNRGFQVVALSGELSQSERSHALQSLRDGRARVCIATDVAARGIDLPGLELVIHADLPSNSETLLHRSGRTGRAGKKGTSVLIVTPADFRKANRILQGAKVEAEWIKAPSAEDVQERDDMRLMEHATLTEAPGDETAMADALIARFGAENVAAAFVRLWREGRSAPEVLSDSLPPVAPAAPRVRGEFGPSVWFKISIGHTGRAEARWLLPKICDAGSIAKDSIGAIRVQQDVTYVQLAEAVASRFRDMTELDKDLMMERLAGEPTLERPERPAYGERPERAPRPERAERPAYSPKPSRIVDEDSPAAPPRTERKPYAPREDAAPRKPYAKREDGDRKPYAPREDGAKRPYTPRPDGERKPWAPREDGPKKPYAPRARAEDGAERKPYVKREEGTERKPRWGAGDKPAGAAPRAAAYKSHAASSDKPARASGFKSHSADGEAPSKRTYAPKGDDARPYVKREGAPKAGGFKSHAAEGKKPYAPRAAKPAAPKTDARDTTKRFVPPKTKR